MKLHDLRPAAGSRRARTRVGRGIAAGQGKTAGRGTKGQKSRAGASIPAWFEGGQTPIHIRVPKLRGFKNRFKVEYSVVNVGQISAYAEAGRFGVELDATAVKGKAKKSDEPVVTVNAELLASAGLIGGTKLPVKVLGQGEVSQKLFVAADAFSASARRKIEEAGGFVQVLAPEKVAPAKDVEPAEAVAPAAPDDPTEDAAPADGAESQAESAAPAKAETAAAKAEVEHKPAKAPRKRPAAKKDGAES